MERDKYTKKAMRIFTYHSKAGSIGARMRLMTYMLKKEELL